MNKTKGANPSRAHISRDALYAGASHVYLYIDAYDAVIRAIYNAKPSVIICWGYIYIYIYIYICVCVCVCIRRWNFETKSSISKVARLVYTMIFDCHYKSIHKIYNARHWYKYILYSIKSILCQSLSKTSYYHKIFCKLLRVNWSYEMQRVCFLMQMTETSAQFVGNQLYEFIIIKSLAWIHHHKRWCVSIFQSPARFRFSIKSQNTAMHNNHYE